MTERVFVVTSDGSAYVRFRRALEIGNELLVLAAARELPRIALDDALRICLVLRDGDPDRYQRAAVRWLGRFALEAGDVTIEDLRLAAESLADSGTELQRRWSGYSAYASPTESGELAVRPQASELEESPTRSLAVNRRTGKAIANSCAG